MFHLNQQATSEIWRYLRDKLRFTKEEAVLENIALYSNFWRYIRIILCFH